MDSDELRARVTLRVRELKQLGASDVLIRDLLNSYVRLFVAHVLEGTEKEMEV